MLARANTTTKLQTLPAAIEMGEPVIAYSGNAALALDDPLAAILICQLWWWTRGGAQTTDVPMERIHATTGINPKRQRTARATLVRHGWLSVRTHRDSGHVRIVYTVHAERVLTACRAQRLKPHPDSAAGPTTESGLGLVPIRGEKVENDVENSAFKGGPTTETVPIKNSDRTELKKESEQLSVADLLAGKADTCSLVEKRALLITMLAEISRQWHGGKRVIVPDAGRTRAWRDFIGAGGLPSDVLKAIAGMRHDTWEKRGDVCDLRHVLRDVDRWVKLYDEKHVRGVTPMWPRGSEIPLGMRTWKGIVVDAAEAMGHADDLNLAAGYVYVIDDRAWVDPADDPRGRVDAHRAKFGEVNITEQARARIDAVKVNRARAATIEVRDDV